MPYTISEISKLTDITPSTIRYYEKEGLLPFIERTKNGLRIFNDTNYEMLKIINCLKKTGMSIKDIRNYVNLLTAGDETLDERLNLFLNHRNDVIKQINTLKETLEILDYKCWLYETAKKDKNVYNLDLKEIPEKYQNAFKKLHN